MRKKNQTSPKADKLDPNLVAISKFTRSIFETSIAMFRPADKTSLVSTDLPKRTLSDTQSSTSSNQDHKNERRKSDDDELKNLLPIKPHYK